MKRITILLIVCVLVSYSFAQDAEHDWRWLSTQASILGKESKEYNDHLVKLASSYSDTCYHAHYAKYALALIENNKIAVDIYGINSLEYRQYVITLNSYFLSGKFVDEHYSEYGEQSASVLLGLEKFTGKAGLNQEEFCNILSGVYKYSKKGYKKALKYARQRFNIAKSNAKDNSTNYAYAVAFYIDALSDCGKTKQSSKEIDKLLTNDNLSTDELAMIYNTIFLSINVNSSDAVWILLLDKSLNIDNALSSKMVALNRLAQANKVDLMKKLDAIISIKSNPIDRIDLYNIWGSYVGNEGGNWGAAAHYHIKAINLADSIHRSDLNFHIKQDGGIVSHWETVCMNYEKNGNHDSAIDAIRNALVAYESKTGKSSKEWVFAARYLSALISNWKSDEKECISINREIISILKENDFMGGDFLREVYCSLLGSLRLGYRYDDAIALGDSLLTVDANLSRNQLRRIHNTLGLCYSELSIPKKGLEHFKTALTYAERTLDSLGILQNVASAYGDLGLNEDSRKVLLGIEDDILNYGSSNDKFYLYDDLAMSATDNVDAIKYFDRAERFITEALTPDRIIAHFQKKSHACGNRLEKISYLDKAVDFFQTTSCQDSILLGILYRDKGDVFADAMDYARADDAYTEALDLLKRLNYKDERLLTLMNNAAANWLNIDNYRREECVRFFRVISKIRQMTFGDGHPVYMTTLSNLYSAYLGVKDYVRADSVITEYSKASAMSDFTHYYIMRGRLSLATGDANGAINHFLMASESTTSETDIRAIMCFLRDAYRQANRKDEFLDINGRLIALVKDDIVKDYFLLTKSERKVQSFYLQNTLDDLISGVNFDPRLAPLAFDFSLFAKGLQFRTDKEFLRVVKKDKQKYEQYISLTDKFNQMVAQGDSISANDTGEQLVKYERELLSTLSRVTKLKKSLMVTKNDVIKNLSYDAIAIDFVRYQIDSSFFYGAFSVSKKTPTPQFIPLCKEDDLQHLISYNTNNDIDKKCLRVLFETGGRGLYKYIWQPLSHYIAGYKDIYFSGTGLLDAIPIEYLKNDKREMMSNVYKLHRVFSLTNIQATVKIGDNILAIGVADHNSPIEYASSTERGGMSNLPQVKTEISNIQRVLLKHKLPHFTSMIDDQAREQAVKELSGSNVSTLHIATHAFYISPKQMEYAVLDPYNGNHYAAMRFMKSGKIDCSAIVLRKGNLTWHSPESDVDDDDILTSDEIEQLDFPNLNLVVLSACQTGKGDADIEGTWGLQRAFRIAGTKSLICTTRQVDSEYAEKFMSHLYEELSFGRSVYDAFQSTRKYLYSDYKSSWDKLTSFILIE